MVGQNKSATFTSPNWTKYHRSPWKHLALLTSQVDIWNRWHLVASFLGKLQACQLKLLEIIQVSSINFIRNIWLFHLHLKDSTFVKSFKKKPNHPNSQKDFQSHFATGARGVPRYLEGVATPVPTFVTVKSSWPIPGHLQHIFLGLFLHGKQTQWKKGRDVDLGSKD